MNAPALVVDGISKKYRIGLRDTRYRTVREAIVGAAKAPFTRFQRLAGRTDAGETFWALRDVSFEVQPGEVVGIIGRNGAGKSTLLKILSRITEPTDGEIRLRGRVGSLLEVGTGFHNELTGRENVYLNGSILGMRRGEMDRKFDAIVEFSGVEQFLDTPVKHYSSGMKVRLGFAVAAHLEPEILIVDEVLAVGDVEFQKRCMGRMSEVAQSGRTVLFVSHNLAAVRSLCRSAIRLDRGMKADEGDVETVIDGYLASLSEAADDVDLSERTDRFGNGAVRIRSVTFLDDASGSASRLSAGQGLRVRLAYEGPHPLPDCCWQLAIYNDGGIPVTFLSNRYTRDLPSALPARGIIECHIPELVLADGRYYVDVCLQSLGAKLDHVERAASFDVQSADFFPSGTTPPASYGVFLCKHNWSLLS